MTLTREALCGLGVAFAFLMAAPASAAVVSDTWADPAGAILLDLDNSPTTGVTSYAYQHDITDDGFSTGDTITAATIYVTVRDSGGAEDYRYEIGIGPTQTNIFSNVPNSRVDALPLLALSLSDLLDGRIDVLMRITGDSNNQEGLYFVSSLLVADVAVNDTPSTSVPEPGILVLIGLGIAALGWSSRRSATR